MKTFGSYFWIISIAFILLSSMPCYAQLEVNHFLTPEGTVWKLYDENPKHNQHVAFLSGYVWFCSWDVCNRFDDSQFNNRLISKFNGTQCFVYNPVPDPVCDSVSGYVIPSLSVGIIKRCTESIVEDACFYNLLIRDDDFTVIP